MNGFLKKSDLATILIRVGQELVKKLTHPPTYPGGFFYCAERSPTKGRAEASSCCCFFICTLSKLAIYASPLIWGYQKGPPDRGTKSTFFLVPTNFYAYNLNKVPYKRQSIIPRTPKKC